MSKEIVKKSAREYTLKNGEYHLCDIRFNSGIDLKEVKKTMNLFANAHDLLDASEEMLSDIDIEDMYCLPELRTLKRVTVKASKKTL